MAWPRPANGKMTLPRAPEWCNGSHVGLKSPCPQGRAGSNPASGTISTPSLFVALDLTRFRGHCRSHESTVGVFHGQAQTTGIYERVQG